MENSSSNDQKRWGISLLSSSMLYDRTRDGSKDYPAWVKPRVSGDILHSWAVIWDNETKKADVRSACECLALLKQLTTTTDWKESGVSLTRSVYRIVSSVERKKKKSKKSSAVIEDEPKEAEQSSGPIDMEVLHLPPEAGEEIISLFEANKARLIRTAEAEEKMCGEHLLRVYKFIFDSSYEEEERKIDFPNRKFPWAGVPDKPHHWLCLREHDRAIVYLDGHQRWCACVEDPAKVRKYKHDFQNLEEAVAWVEAELSAQNPMPISETKAMTPEALDAIHQRLREKIAGSPFWIRPEDLEATRITYRILLDVEAKPVHQKTFEDVFGDKRVLEEQYASPLKLADQLHLDPNHFEISNPLGKDTDWVRFSSLNTFFQETLAISQAQDWWNQSLVPAQFKSGQIKRARYGYQEVETGYMVYLGGCFPPEEAWGENNTRQEHLEERALKLSLLNALEPGLFREYLGEAPTSLRDEELLRIMHETRARSRFLPPEARKASQIWLIEHPDS